MRDIKLRAWDVENKKMVADVAIDSESNQPMRYCELSGRYDDIHGLPMQFTGLQDKNGVDIYEGDIVKCRYSFSISPVFNTKLSRFIGVATFNILKSCVSIDGVKQYGNKQGVLHKAICIEVIGNIYESPELI